MAKALKIRDITLLNSQHTIFKRYIRPEEFSSIVPLYRAAGFYIVEVWDGEHSRTVAPSTRMVPWRPLEALSEKLKGATLLSAIAGGKRLFGTVPYPDFVVDSFYRKTIESGIEVLRLLDYDNEMENMTAQISMVNADGGIADAAVCLMPEETEEPHEPVVKKRGFLSRLFGTGDPTPESSSKPVYNDDYYVEKAKEMEAAGASIISLMDIEGEVTPGKIYTLMPKIKQAVKGTVDFYTRATEGRGLASALTAIIKGVDIIDSTLWWFADGKSAPAIELILLFCRRLEIEVDVNMEAITAMRTRLSEILEEKKLGFTYLCLPNDFDKAIEEMPEEIDALFDKAIEAATDNDEETLTSACRRIEEYFGIISRDEPEDTEQPRDEEYEKNLLFQWLPDVATAYFGAEKED